MSDVPDVKSCLGGTFRMDVSQKLHKGENNCRTTKTCVRVMLVDCTNESSPVMCALLVPLAGRVLDQGVYHDQETIAAGEGQLWGSLFSSLLPE